MAKNDLIFKYGEGDVPSFNDATSAGTIYIKKKSDTKAEMFIHTPLQDEDDDKLTLQVGGFGNVYVGDPTNPEASEYQAVINPNGDVIDNIVTSEESGGYIIRVVESEDPDNYDITADNPARNVITLVV